jgi:translation initiation factor 3 subunit B
MGDFLCVKVDRHTKTKKTQYCNLELFRLRDKDCPVQVIEIKGVSTRTPSSRMTADDGC